MIALAGSGGTLDETNNTGSLVLTGTVSGSNTDLLLTGAPGANGNAFITGQVSLGTGSLTKTGAGTWYLRNTSNSYSGATMITAGVLSTNDLATLRQHHRHHAEWRHIPVWRDQRQHVAPGHPLGGQRHL